MRPLHRTLCAAVVLAVTPMLAAASRADAPAPAAIASNAGVVLPAADLLPPVGVPLWQILDPAAWPAPSVGVAGMVVARDPETGKLVPATSEQRRLLGLEIAPRPLIVPVMPEVRLPDGSVMSQLDDRFMDYSVARRDASGALRFDCVHGSGQALRLVGSRQVPPSSVPVEE